MHGSINDAMVQGFYGTRSYSSFHSASLARFLSRFGHVDARDRRMNWSLGVDGSPCLEALSSVRFVLTRTPALTLKERGEILREVGRAGDVSVLEHALALPLGVVVDRRISEQEGMNIPLALRECAPLLGAITDAHPELIEWSQADADALAGLVEDRHLLTARITELTQHALVLDVFDDDHFSGHVDVTGKGMLVLGFPYDTGWHARVDGVAAATEVVNYGLTGLFLEAGRHRIELDYETPGQRVAILLGGATGLLLVASMLRARVRG